MANNIKAALMRADLAKLPLWLGDVSKDGYTIEQWVTRVNKAATTAAWSDEDTMGTSVKMAGITQTLQRQHRLLGRSSDRNARRLQ